MVDLAKVRMAKTDFEDIFLISGKTLWLYREEIAIGDLY
jgi:hypothetical protein